MAHEVEWLTGIVRWLHVLTGIVWIGTSFHLFSWEYRFNRENALRPEVEGSLWMIQGGDFYHIEKLRKAPLCLPKELTWFKYEAYFTWLSGFVLLVLVYYINAEGMLVNPSSHGISPSSAVAASAASIAIFWLAYQGYCKTPMAGSLPLTAAIGILATVILAYSFSRLFGGSAAMLHLGILMGTIMSANVFFVIIPWHKSLLEAIRERRPLDTLYDRHPGIRSDHNHYLALPVVFLMLGSHLPIAYNHPYGWIAISVCVLAAGLIKHAHSLQQAGRTWPAAVCLAGGVFCFAGAASLTKIGAKDYACSEPATFNQVREIVDAHCIRCHSSMPTDPTLSSPPNEVIFETHDEIDARRDRILYRAVIAQTMPPGNKTHMQDDERALLRCWIQSRTGAGPP